MTQTHFGFQTVDEREKAGRVRGVFDTVAPRYDLMAQGIGGFMSLTGTADGEPTRAGVPVSDIFTGVYSVIGILAALQQRERTGKGCYVDTALVDSTVGVLANQAKMGEIFGPSALFFRTCSTLATRVLTTPRPTWRKSPVRTSWMT